jgi:hypothetical protein
MSDGPPEPHICPRISVWLWMEAWGRSWGARHSKDGLTGFLAGARAALLSTRVAPAFIDR